MRGTEWRAVVSRRCSTSAATARAAVGFEFWHAHTGPTGAVIAGLCDAFNDSQPDWRVTCVAHANYETAMKAAMAAHREHRPPALIQFLDVGTLDMLMSASFIPVHELMARVGAAVDWTDYYPPVRGYYGTRDGRLVSQPFNASTLLLYINRDRFEAAGVTRAPETWEEFGEALRKVKASGESCPFGNDLNPWRDLEQMHALHGVPLASRSNGFEGLDAEYLFNGPLHVRYAAILG